MSAVAHLSASPSHRTRVLRALGVMPWVQRAAASSRTNDTLAVTAPMPEAQVGDCVVLLPAGCDTKALDLLGRALHAFGPALARAARIEVRDGQLSAAPVARAYLVFGEAQAHALGRELPAATLNQAHIVLADEPAGVHASAAGKRRLWQALRNLRRALAQSGA
ncbi:hypothetical protein SAMN05216570_2176 [Dyella sp. OK004]|uniref:hypothetical protein n=1 Tax=Dyella sp. OK004 TaxID=1855292 RepID=UPI0008EEF327|nr:hypothetical protein [Dyella sp. OK004]SFS06708.1 hypothetical protein SAMN05216570_2176 [Dyella sp. OK004]